MPNLKSLTPQPRASKSGPFNVPAPSFEKVDGETIPYRNAKSKDKLIERPHEDINTVYDIVKYGSANYGNARCMGSRKLVKMHNETKKVKKIVDGQEQEVDKNWSYFELSGYEYKTFIEYEQLVHKAGAGLRKLGLQSQEKVELFAGTSANWLTTAHGAMSQSIAIVTAYDTLGEEGLKHSLTQTGAKAIYLDAALFPKLVNPLKAAKDLQHVIYNVEGDYKQELLEKMKSEHPNVTFNSFDELLKLGEENPIDPNPPTPDDVACVMYTSGSTGSPKGVMLKHRNVVASVAGADAIVGPYLGPGDGLLTYLPLAHILEFVFENACLFWGGTMGYGKIRTLSDVSVRNCKGDIREFRPTILVGVPAVWEQIKKGIVSNVQAQGALTSKVFWGAMAAKSFLMGWGLPGSAVLDSIVFNKVKERTGGRLRICMNGGGPIAKDTQQFISMAITPLISGYGLTETAAMGALTDPAGWTNQALGEMPGSIEIKLVDFPDAGYYATNKPPQGEVWIRGPPVTEGYLDLEKETQEAYTNDGWFKTGDIGEFDHKGQLRVIDRKKNLVKTQAGEYIALEKLESLYRTCEVVANICVYAAEDQNNPVAIIVPAEAPLKKLAESNGIKETEHEKLIHDKKVNSLVTQQLQAAGKKGNLASFEMIAGVVIAEEEWTPENGFTTAATKIDRRKILNKYQKGIDHAYGKK